MSLSLFSSTKELESYEDRGKCIVKTANIFRCALISNLSTRLVVSCKQKMLTLKEMAHLTLRIIIFVPFERKILKQIYLDTSLFSGFLNNLLKGIKRHCVSAGIVSYLSPHQHNYIKNINSDLSVLVPKSEQFRVID